MAEMKTFQGYEIVDAQARKDLKNLQDTTQQTLAEIEQAIPSLDGYATETWVEDKKYLTEHQSLEGKADKEHTHPQYLTEHQSLDNYYTKAQTDSAIGEAINGIKIPEVDLTPYAKVADMPTKVSQLENDKGYLTEHQSLDGYATETYVSTKIEEAIEDAEVDISGKADLVHQHSMADITDYEAPDLSGYAKTADIPTKVSELNNDSGYLTEHQSLADYAKKTDIPDVSDFITSIPEEYITETELTAKGYLTEHQSLDNYTTKQYVDDAIANIDVSDVNLSNYYTKAQTDAAIYTSKDAYYLDFSQADFEEKPATAEMIECATRWVEGRNVCAHCYYGASFSLKGYVPVTINGLSLEMGVIFTPAVIDPLLVEEQTPHNYLKVTVKLKSTGEIVYYISAAYNHVLATKEYVDEAVENAGGASSWEFATGGIYTPDLYLAKEVYVSVYSHLDSVTYSSCAVFAGETLTSKVSNRFATNVISSDGTPLTWYFDGANILLDGNSDGNYELQYVAYKV